MNINLDHVRAQFPALDGPWTFFDNAGGSQTLAPVMKRIQEYLEHSNVQLGATYEVSQNAGARVALAAETMARYINAATVDEVVMGPSTSMLLRILSQCLASNFHPGDEVIVTNCDHEANIGPWVDLADHGIEVKMWRLDPETLELNVDDLKNLMTDRTRLVALTHASNILGTINPIKDIARLVHDNDALVCVDGVAYAPHRRIDVRALDVDFYAFSFYKVYGPHYALLYGKRDILLDIPGMNHFFIGKHDLPYKFQPGNVNYELSYGMVGLWDYLEGFATAHGMPRHAEGGEPLLDFVFDVIARHEQALSTRLLSFLKTKPQVRICGRTEPDRGGRVPTISFTVGDRDSDSIVRAVDPYRIGIRYGDFYARRLIHDLGLARQNGVVRVSMVHYNTIQEVDHLIEILDAIV